MERERIKPLRYEPFNHELKSPGFDLFVPKGQEQDYLKTHDIEFVFLPNGSLTVFRHIDSKYRPQADINLTFPTGSYNDPEGKAGLAHLVEHLFASDAVITANRSGADNFNATTHLERIVVDLSGTADPNVREYGVWPIIPFVFKKIANPTDVSKERFEKEKQNIILEKRIRDDDWQAAASSFRAINLFHPHNPNHVYSVRNQEEVMGVTLADVDEMVSRSLVSGNFLAEVKTYGDSNLKEAIKESILPFVSDFPRVAQNPDTVDPLLFARMNPNHENGNFYAFDTHLAHDQMEIRYNYHFPAEYFTNSLVARQFIFDIANTKLFDFARREGLSYSTGTSTNVLGYSESECEISLRIPRIPDYEAYASNLYESIKREVIDVTRQDFPHALEMIKNNARIIPPINEAYGSLVGGYNVFGKIINLEAQRNWTLGIVPKDLELELDKILATDPAIFVAGKLS